MKIVGIQGDKGFFADCDRMATAIIELLKNNGSCRPEDLKAEGFTQGEIEQHWRMAYGLAKVELNWLEAY